METRLGPAWHRGGSATLPKSHVTAPPLSLHGEDTTPVDKYVLPVDRFSFIWRRHRESREPRRAFRLHPVWRLKGKNQWLHLFWRNLWL